MEVVVAWIAAIVGIVTMGYLMVALIWPEWF